MRAPWQVLQPLDVVRFDPGTALLLAGAGAGALGSISQGNQQAAASNANAQQLEARASADTAQAAAQATLDQQNSRRQMAAAFANAGASGVDPGQGSPLSVMSDLAAQGELTRRLSIYRGDVASTGDLNQAALTRWQGSQAKQAGFLRAGTTLLTAAGFAGMQNGWFGGSGVDPKFVGGSASAGATTYAPSSAFYSY